jgi:hypothetical protein
MLSAAPATGILRHQVLAVSERGGMPFRVRLLDKIALPAVPKGSNCRGSIVVPDDLEKGNLSALILTPNLPSDTIDDACNPITVVKEVNGVVAGIFDSAERQCVPPRLFLFKHKSP